MTEDSKPMGARRRQAAVTFIAITVVIDVLGFGVIIPVLPRLVQQFMGGDPVRGAAVYPAWEADPRHRRAADDP